MSELVQQDTQDTQQRPDTQQQPDAQQQHDTQPDNRIHGWTTGYVAGLPIHSQTTGFVDTPRQQHLTATGTRRRNRPMGTVTT